MTDLAPLLHRIADYAAAYRAGVTDRPHRPGVTAEDAQARFNAPVPERGAAIDDVIEELITLAEPGLAAMTGPRFFGWVIGGSAPAGVAADWLASAWGQNTGNALATPSASACEEIAARWLLDLL